MLTVRIDAVTLAALDEIRGSRTRSDVIRELILLERSQGLYRQITESLLEPEEK